MVVFWENRGMQHAVVDDYYPQRRMMERATRKGDRRFGTGYIAPIAELRRLKAPFVMEFKN